MNLADRKFTELMKGKRPMLLNTCKRLFKLKRGPSQIRTVNGMVSWLTGKRMGQKGSWLWLLEEGLKQLPAKKAKRPYKHLGASFYDSSAWRALRFDVLKESNGCCCLCGRSHRAHGVEIHVDHIKPKSLYPELALTKSNLQCLCKDCNLGKSNRDDTDWRTATDVDRALDAVDWRMQ